MATPLQEIPMDLCNSLHPVPSAWLGESDLATFVPAYVQRLVSRRYAVATVRVYVHCVAHFAHWIHHCRLFAEDITDDVVQCFLDKHLPICKCSTPVQRSRHQVRAALPETECTLDRHDFYPLVRQSPCICSRR